MATYGVTYHLYVVVDAEDEEQAEELADKRINESIEANDLAGYLCDYTTIEEI